MATTRNKRRPVRFTALIAVKVLPEMKQRLERMAEMKRIRLADFIRREWEKCLADDDARLAQ